MMKKPKLFRLTPAKKDILTHHIKELDRRICAIDAQSLRRAFLMDNDVLSPKLKEEKLRQLDDELEKFSLQYDVLKTILYHSEKDTWLRRTKQPRDWKNEWDIPFEIFQDVMNHILGTEENSQHVQLFEELKSFRQII